MKNTTQDNLSDYDKATKWIIENDFKIFDSFMYYNYYNSRKMYVNDIKYKFETSLTQGESYCPKEQYYELVKIIPQYIATFEIEEKIRKVKSGWISYENEIVHTYKINIKDYVFDILNKIEKIEKALEEQEDNKKFGKIIEAYQKIKNIN